LSFNPYLRTTRSAAAVRNAAAETAEIVIFDEIGFFGVNASDFRAELKAVSAANIDVRINSPGGDVFDAIAIYNLLLEHPANITTYNDGLAASAAATLMLAGDTRISAKNSQWMIHDAWGMAIGNADDMRSAADFLERQTEIIASIFVDRVGGKAEDWRALMSDETWFNADEALAAGLATQIGSQAAAENSFDLSVFRRTPAALLRDEPNPVDPQPVTPDWRNEALLAVAAADMEVARANAH
jgi:ATP-dependent protease ClpP protease subunit